MNKNRKKLPKYVLGTMGKYPLGYLPSRGLGDATFSSTPGLSAEPELRAMRSNFVPSLLGHASTLGTFGYQMGSNIVKSGANTAASTGSSAGSSAGSAAFNVAGKAASAAAALYGAAGLTSDIIGAGEHRTASDMALTESKSQYTTAGGNTYTVYGNPNRLVELDIASLKHKQTTWDLVGHGAAAGGGIGGLAYGPIGALVGTAVGALGGGLAGLFGVGDNEDAVIGELQALSETNVGRNRMGLSIAESKDVERAADGRIPVYSAIGKLKGKATARVSNGELIGNFEDGYVSRVPGKKNNKDSKLAALKDSDFVISNKYGLSDYAAATGDYIGALNMLLGLLHNKYKNGRLPRFVNGYAAMAIPRIPEIGLLLKNLNEDKTANIYAGNPYEENPEGRRAVNVLSLLDFDMNPYYKQARQALKEAQWENRRNVGLGIGGRAVAQNAIYQQHLKGLQELVKMYNDAKSHNTQLYANALANLGNTNQARRIDSNAKYYQALREAAGAKFTATRNDRALLGSIFPMIGNDLFSVAKEQNANAYRDYMASLYGQSVANETAKTNAEINNLINNNTNNTYYDIDDPYGALRLGRIGLAYMNWLRNPRGV